MITTAPTVASAEWEAATGWHLETQGMCLGDRCVPVAGMAVADGRFDLEELARRTGRVVVHDELHGLWAVGPEANAPVLSSTELPHLLLEDRTGNQVDLRTFLGRRMVIHAWAPW